MVPDRADMPRTEGDGIAGASSDRLRRALSRRGTAAILLATLVIAIGSYVLWGLAQRHIDNRDVAAFVANLGEEQRDQLGTEALTGLSNVLTSDDRWLGRTQIVYQRSGTPVATHGAPIDWPRSSHVVALGDTGITARIAHSNWQRLAGSVFFVGMIAGLYLAILLLLTRPQMVQLEARHRRSIATQDELKASEARFRGLAMLTADMLWETDAEGNTTYLTTTGGGRLEQQLRSFNHAVGRPIGDLFDRLSPGARADLEHRLAQRAPFAGLQTDCNTARGPLYLVSTGRPRFDDGGRFAGFQGATRDVTDLVTSRAAADATVQQINSLFENSPTAILITQVGRGVVRANRTLLQWHGRPEDDPTYDRLIVPDPEDRAWLRNLDQQVLEYGRPIEGERLLTFANGQQRRIATVKFLIGSGDDDQPLIGTIHTDISKQHDAEERLARAQKMEAIGQLTGGIAHDFNNLLTVIRGNVELIGMRLDEDDDNRKSLDSIARATDSGAALTQQLLAFARRQRLTPTPVDVAATLEDLSNMLDRALREDVTVVIERPDDLPRIRADRSQLEAALLNLALNAQDAMPEGGTLNITASADAELPGHVRIDVRDNGTGIPKEVQERVLEPFFTTKESGRGTGLGLSMVYGFVKQSGGEMEIESAVGEGTTVSLVMPQASDAGTFGHDARERERVEQGKGHVLLVEDNPDVRVLAHAMVSSLGYRVDLAQDADEALALLRRDVAYDVLLTDVVLPGAMSGLTLAERVHGEHPGMRIIVTSGYANSDLSEQGPMNDAFTFLPKPYRLASVSAALGSQTD